MLRVIPVAIPPSLEGLSDHLQGFFDTMIKKLDKNSWKETPTIHSIPEIVGLMIEEVTEFEVQFYSDAYDENVLVELADAANFAFLAYVALRIHGFGNGKP